jgi:hypothetical protein
MYVSGERVGCLRRLMLGRGVACNNCGSVGSFIIKSARWSTTSPLALEVASNCANCGGGPRPRFLRKRPGVVASRTPTRRPYAKAVLSPGSIPTYVPGKLSSLPPLPTLIQRSAWKGYSRKYAVAISAGPVGPLGVGPAYNSGRVPALHAFTLSRKARMAVVMRSKDARF